MNHQADLKIAVIAGSTRPGRQSLAVAEWVSADPPAGLELTVIDLAEVNLPLLSEPVPAAMGQYQQQATREWARLIAGFDGFVLVSPEYNHSTSAALKNALDHLYLEWNDKAVAFVGYGIDGGQRAVEHLRTITAELAMAGVGPQVSLSLRDDYRDKRLGPRSFQVEARSKMLAALDKWARALRSLRAPAEGSAVQAETAAMRQFVAGLQAGLDAADADHYDAQFAPDVLWGSPYGATLAGYPAVNTAHRRLMASGVAPRSRYEIMQMLVPAPGVVIAHVRRQALDSNGFSEMALYVLTEREGRWQLTAGQNTPIAPAPSR